jgi:transcriptional regulator with XRE-family HTH domain
MLYSRGEIIPIMSMGKRIQARLEELEPKGITVAVLAQACGVTPSAVYQWISGDTKGLKPENLVKTADLLRVHIRWLVYERGPKERAIRDKDLEPDEDALMAAYRALDDTQKKAMVATVQHLAKERKKRQNNL